MLIIINEKINIQEYKNAWMSLVLNYDNHIKIYPKKGNLTCFWQKSQVLCWALQTPGSRLESWGSSDEQY